MFGSAVPECLFKVPVWPVIIIMFCRMLLTLLKIEVKAISDSFVLGLMSPVLETWEVTLQLPAKGRGE